MNDLILPQCVLINVLTAFHNISFSMQTLLITQRIFVSVKLVCVCVRACARTVLYLKYYANRSSSTNLCSYPYCLLVSDTASFRRMSPQQGGSNMPH